MTTRLVPITILGLSVLAPCCAFVALQEIPYFQVRAVDQDTGRGIPLVEVETIHHLRYVTDNNGIIAFYEPGLMGQEVYFHVRSHGYEYPADGFGYRGIRLKAVPGGKATITLKRINVAERLYRITGAGLYVDSVLTKQPVPLREPLLNAQVLGQDSVLQAVYRGKVYWFWGDTLRPSYPLGNFHATAGTSPLPGSAALDIDNGLDLDYFRAPNGFVKPICPMPGPGPTWITSVITISHQGRERLYAGYAKVKGFLDIYQRGLAVFDDEKQQFVPVTVYPDNAALYPQGHTFVSNENGQDYIYFCNPFPLVRVPAHESALRDHRLFEAYTCLLRDNDRIAAKLDRNAAEQVNYSWKKDTPFLKGGLLRSYIEKGLIKPQECLIQLRDIDSGKTIQPHSGSVYWNAWRRKWIGVILEQGGSSFLGEVWYAEADTPTGPWVYARKIVTHDKYSFYNPKHHPIFDKQGGRIIYFEGTFTTMFSGNDRPVPRYEYNQILYRLDLADPRLTLPVPVYMTTRDKHVYYHLGHTGSHYSPTKDHIAFFALDRPTTEAVAIYAVSDERGQRLTRDKPDVNAKPVFYALSVDAKERPNTFLLYEYVSKVSGQRYYGPESAQLDAHIHRSEKPLCRVCESPYGTARP